MGIYATYVAARDDELAAVAADADALPESFYAAQSGLWKDNPSTALDKMWHGLHFVLTGSPTAAPIAGMPLSAAVFGSDTYDAGDGGYATTIASHHVAEVAAALRAVDRDALAATFEPQQLDEHDIYPAGIWLDAERELLTGELRASLDALTAFYEAAQAQGLGVLVQIM